MLLSFHVFCMTAILHGALADTRTDGTDATTPPDESMKHKMVSEEAHKLALLQTEFKALKESFAEMKESATKEMKAMKESAAMEAAALREIIATKTAFIEHRLKQLESRPIQASVDTTSTLARPERRRLSEPADGSTAGISFTPEAGA